jgi:predicted metal-binding membrane protein
MDTSRTLEFLLKRDRALILAAIVGISALAWGYMAYEARVMYHTGICCCAGMKMSGPDASAWSTATLLPLFLMWAEMMVAMMLPTAAPMILTFAMVQRKRREQERPFVSTSLFVSGYLIVWTGFSVFAATAQWILHGQALLSPMMVSNSPILGGTLLIVAGIFQFASIKNKCLSQCRSPLSFLMTDWREGKLGALKMGLSHGLHCAGCCWFLMVLLFVAGVMNLWWIAAITFLVLLEKVVPKGLLVGRIAGVLFVGWGAWLMAGSH